MSDRDVYRTGEVPLLGSGMKTLFGMPQCSDINDLSADIAFLGVPYDYGSPQWVQTGTRHGPNGTRQARSAYNYSDPRELKSACGWFNVEEERVELENVTMADCGDVYMEPWEGLKNLERVTDAVRQILDRGAFPLVVGGDHTTTFPVVRGFDRYDSLDIVHFDAHLDFEDRRVERVDNTTSLRRCSELPFVRTITQIGARSPFPLRSKRAYEDAIAWGEKVITVKKFRELGPQGVIDAIPEAQHIYISFDIDGLDPTIAMGTSTPMPSGLYLEEVVEVIRGVAKKGKVIGFDLVEFSPDFDVSNITARTIAELLLFSLSAIFPSK
jgi:agmatinase